MSNYYVLIDFAGQTDGGHLHGHAAKSTGHGSVEMEKVEDLYLSMPVLAGATEEKKRR